MLYGRLATSAVGGGPGSSWMRSASAVTTVSRSARSGRRAATVTGQQVGQPRVDLDGHDAGRRRQQPQGQRAQPGPDLEDDVVGPEAGGAHDPPDRVGVVQEVLPERLGRPQVQLLGQLADRGRTQQPVRLLGAASAEAELAGAAGPGAPALRGPDLLADGDLLLTGGLVGRRGVLGAAVGAPTCWR